MPYITVTRTDGTPVMVRTSIIDMVEKETRTSCNANSYLQTSTQGKFGIKEHAHEVARMIEEVEAHPLIMATISNVATEHAGPLPAHNRDLKGFPR